MTWLKAITQNFIGNGSLVEGLFVCLSVLPQCLINAGSDSLTDGGELRIWTSGKPHPVPGTTLFLTLFSCVRPITDKKGVGLTYRELGHY